MQQTSAEFLRIYAALCETGWQFQGSEAAGLSVVLAYLRRLWTEDTRFKSRLCSHKTILSSFVPIHEHPSPFLSKEKRFFVRDYIYT